MGQETEDQHFSRRRNSFGDVAEQYDRHRPGYPQELVDDVIAYAGAEPGGRALEVGAGTGKATLLFAARGLEITAFEPSAGMSAVARERTAAAGYEVDFIGSDFEAAFEQIGLPEHAFQLVFSATAWHWITPVLRNRLAARALVQGGALAPFWNRVLWQDNPIRPALDEVYSAVEREHGLKPAGPMNPFGQLRDIRATSGWLEGEFPDAAIFTDTEVRTYISSRSYTADAYIELIGSHSDHNLLEPSAQMPLYQGIRDAINAAGGSIEITYESLLCLARAV